MDLDRLLGTDDLTRTFISSRKIKTRTDRRDRGRWIMNEMDMIFWAGLEQAGFPGSCVTQRHRLIIRIFFASNN
jgi:hypothetical protein